MLRARQPWPELISSLAMILFFAVAAAMTLDLAVAEVRYRDAAGEPEISPTEESLHAAVAANTRDSASWIALGLAAERRHDLQQAAQYFRQAEKVDRRYLPAWSYANFSFRQGDSDHFWSAAARASAMIYDDSRPLIALADRMEADPASALERLHAKPVLERAYLDFLIGEQRWKSAQTVALKISARHDPADRGRLRDFVGRLQNAGRRDLALPLCRELRDFHDCH